MAARDPALLSVGPGKLYFAPTGTAEPTDLTAAWNVAWLDLGYTDEGHVFTVEMQYADLFVAEEFDPVRTEPSSRTAMIEFNLAEITATNLKRALNGGTITTGTGIATYVPPAASAVPTECMIGWESIDASERLVCRRCIQTKAVGIARKKGDYSRIPTAFKLLKPASGEIFTHIFSTARA